jgi:NADH:ubiquinone oxidoreductase subunit 6 (subunit J)
VPDFVFWILAVLSVAAALAVVFLKDIFRAALSLIVLFIVIAGVFLLLNADFLAIVQILVYVGAISILIIVGIMLTRDTATGNPFGKFGIAALVVSILLLVLLVMTAVNTTFVISKLAPLEPTTVFLGDKLFGQGGYLLPVELTAILLLTAILGAIALMRDK